jgi:hypothetical protein
MEDDDVPMESLLPYDAWASEALRAVVLTALDHAAQHGLPGDHHFYVTFRTDYPGVSVPDRLRERYPAEMTIVLQHQYRDLLVDFVQKRFSVTLSFGGVPSTLEIPVDAVTGFADPHVQFGLQFVVTTPTIAAPEPEPAPEPDTDRGDAAEPGSAPVVSLDAFRRRTPPKS